MHWSTACSNHSGQDGNKIMAAGKWNNYEPSNYMRADDFKAVKMWTVVWAVDAV
jgi:hypothetical protein